MPETLGLRFCAEPGCSTRVPRGRCPQHARTSAHRRGYDAHWERFRTVTYPMLLLEQGIYIHTCGARLQPGPHPYSECAKAGIGTFTELELDHDPPLKHWERAHPRIVCDPARIGGYLCKTCHAKKTRHERGGEPPPPPNDRIWKGMGGW